MQRIAFTMKIKPGAQEDYRWRHRQVWPELLADLKRAGCRNYSIYLRGTDLFAYLEVEDFSRYLEVMAESAASALGGADARYPDSRNRGGDWFSACA